jgi:hypothetical protein
LAEPLGNDDVAYHEAGHCVVAHALGATIKRSTIIPEEAFGLPGLSEYDFGDMPLGRKTRRQLVAFLGGQAANDLRLGSAYLHSPSMGDLIWRHHSPHPVAAGISEGGSDFKQAREAAEQHLSDVAHWTDLLLRARWVAERIVARPECRARLGAIAAALRLNGHLDAHGIEGSLA